MKIKIYQAKNPTFRVDKDKVVYNLNDYNMVYEFEHDIPEYADKHNLLEWVFDRFNIARPTDFNGHSLSVGDIVELQSDFSGRLTETYICSDFGWKKILWEEQ